MGQILIAAMLAGVLGATAAQAAGYDDFAMGLSAINSHNADIAIADFTTALAAGDLSPKLIPVAYCYRGGARIMDSDSDGALADGNAGLKLKPNYPFCVLVRAQAEALSGAKQDAIVDYTGLIATAPGHLAYWERAQLYWDMQEYSEAAADFRWDMVFAPDPALSLIWLTMSQTKAGTFDEDATDKLASEYGASLWHRQILELFEGKGKPEDVIAAASEGFDENVPWQQCEAEFFVGEWWLVQKNIVVAKLLFEKARKDCPPGFELHDAAIAELERLK